MVNLEPVCEMADSGALPICMGDDDDPMSECNKLLRNVIKVRFDSAMVRVEEI